MAVLSPQIGCSAGDSEYDKLRYGTHVFYLNAMKTIGLIIVACLLGILPYVTVFALAYGALRAFSFGVHLRNTFLCTLFGYCYYLGSAYLSIYVPMPLPVRIAAMAASFILFALYAPAQTKKRPIPERQRSPFKIKALCVLVILMVGTILLRGHPVYSNLLCMAMVCQTINLLPITYKLLKGS